MMYKMYRRMMRKIARWILGFDKCPASYRRNYKQEFLTVLGMMAMSAFFVTLFFTMFLLS